MLVVLLLVVVAASGAVAAEPPWCSSGNATGEVAAQTEDRPCRAPLHSTDGYRAPDTAPDRTGGESARRGQQSGKYRSNAGPDGHRGRQWRPGQGTVAGHGRGLADEQPSGPAADAGRGPQVRLPHGTVGSAVGAADRPKDADEPAEHTVAAAADELRANAESRQYRPDSSLVFGDIRERLPADETPVGYGGVAVFGGFLVARRAGMTAGIAPDVVSSTARISSDAVPSAVRRAAEVVRRWVSDGGWLLGAGLYSRRDDSDPLAHDKRSAAYELIQRSPGVNPSALADRLDIPLSTTRHHLRVLEQEGLVKDRKIAGKRRFVALGTEASEHVAALRDTATARVLRVLARHGPSSVSGLAEYLERDPSTVTHHLKRLESASLVDRRRDGRTVTNELTKSARSLLRTGLTGDGPADRFDSSD